MTKEQRRGAVMTDKAQGGGRPRLVKVPSLYRVTSTVSEHRGHEDVTFSWFVQDRREPVFPYEEVIEGYDPDAEGVGYAEGAVDELFTLTEANVLADYLWRAWGDDSVEITEVPLPLSGNTMPIGAIPMGLEQDVFMLSETKGYDLPLDVWGYYDLRQHEFVKYVGESPRRVVKKEPVEKEREVYVVLGVGEGHEAVQEAFFPTLEEAEDYVEIGQQKSPIGYVSIERMPLSQVDLDEVAGDWGVFESYPPEDDYLVVLYPTKEEAWEGLLGLQVGEPGPDDDPDAALFCGFVPRELAAKFRRARLRGATMLPCFRYPHELMWKPVVEERGA
jgi:hypothetical protein